MANYADSFMHKMANNIIWEFNTKSSLFPEEIQITENYKFKTKSNIDNDIDETLKKNQSIQLNSKKFQIHKMD